MMNQFRVGFGYDVHKLEKNKDFWLGGIKIPHYKGSTGHSDADTAIHAIIDALLGAANLGDIGTHFPDSDEDYAGIDSKILLDRTLKLINDNGYSIGNIDLTIVLQKPKISDYIPSMRITLADVLGIDKSQISVKAKTTEGLGFEGSEQGVSVYTIALIISNK
jgi:2-C-methyl-D-erythritol 2,4-cyclodiphosphate synthase